MVIWRWLAYRRQEAVVSQGRTVSADRPGLVAALYLPQRRVAVLICILLLINRHENKSGVSSYLNGIVYLCFWACRLRRRAVRCVATLVPRDTARERLPLVAARYHPSRMAGKDDDLCVVIGLVYSAGIGTKDA